MKRSPIQRKTPLQSTTPLQARHALTRKAPLVARSGPKRTPYRAPRPSVTPAERWARKVVKARAEDRCEGCGRPGRLDYSHRIGRGVGGPWHPANALALCRRDHQFVGDQPHRARVERGWRLESTDNYLTFPAWIYGRGWVLLDDTGEMTPVRDIEETA